MELKISTNFKLKKGRKCPLCNNSVTDTIYIGKRFSAGDGDNSFIFHTVPADSQVGPIGSVDDLRRTLPAAEKLGWVIVDEEGVLYTAADFLGEVDRIPIEKRGLHHLMVQKQCTRYNYIAPEGDYLDSEGFSFSSSEFS